MLEGKKRVGRSRTAQYGLVEISSDCRFEDVKTYADSSTIVVYADSRLIFLDDNSGLPTCQPTVQQLLGENAEGEIVWEKSQIRTFQYAPWNFKRQCYDTDRCGIEKGSVFVIKNCKNADISSHYVGSYRNEGFGKVIFNPDFLQNGGENGLSKCKFEKMEDGDDSQDISTSDSPLFKYLLTQKEKESKTQTVYKSVNEFSGAGLFIGKEKFASQWGTIRKIALQEKDNEQIRKKIEDYISHGVKKEDWEGQRANALIEFMKANKDTLWESIINLASEMAKKCKKDE